VKRIGDGEELVLLDPLEHANRGLDEDGVLGQYASQGGFLAEFSSLQK
jgi:hypothetical protein